MNFKNLLILEILAFSSLFVKNIAPNGFIEDLQKEQQTNDEIKYQLKRLFNKVDQESRFDSCLLLGREDNIRDTLVAEVLQEDMGKTLLVQTFTRTFCSSCLKLNQNFILFIFWRYGDEDTYSRLLSQFLEYKRSNRIILLAPVHLSALFADIVSRYMFEKCVQNNLLNVIILLGNFYETMAFFAFELYPQFTLVNRSFGHDATEVEVFPNKMSNLHGHRIRTYPDQMIPRSVVYRDQYGLPKMKGYVVSFLETFAKSINGTLWWPLNLQDDKPVFYQNIFDMAKADRFDIPTALVPALYGNSSKIMSRSYEERPWCIMVPVEKPHSYKEFIYRSLNPLFFLRFVLSMMVLSLILEFSTKIMYSKLNQDYEITLDKIILNTKIFRGIFGCSFKLQPNSTKSLKILYTILFIRGLLITVQFSAILQSFLTHPLIVPVKNLKDLQANNLKIVIFKNDLDFIKNSRSLNYKRFLPGLEIFEDYYKYRELHSSFNTSYAYPVHHSQWYIYRTQQSSLPKPLFRLSSMCLNNMGNLGFVLPQNSLYLQPLNKFIIRANELGLPEYWMRLSYIELKKIGKIKNIPNPILEIEHRTMGPEEFNFIFEIMLKCYIFAFILLIAEIVCSKIYCKIECGLKK
ncbi:uncharacterized protein LOC101887199 [Musca domestica]|uniref:Uncharacterized protein LOC101887199 n=1 Tax=Musca domestica TaxID=7370 RepID=A0A9J7HXV9_MUSDO|nr:uncharacterized protein LOC101887199 [Musca domestica]